MVNKKMKIDATLLTLLLVISIAITGSLTSVKANPNETIVYVDPPEVRDLQPPETFTINVKIADVTDLYGIDLQFGWDPTIIEYVGHTAKIPVETYPDGILHEPGIWIRNDVDETGGLVDLGAEPGTLYWLAYASMYPATPFEGSGIAFEMTFHVVGVGSCWLKITSCTLADSGGFDIPHITKDGYFSNYIPTPVDIFVYPPTIIDSTLGPCTNFAINVTIESVVDLYEFEFWLSYNNTVLEVVDVIVLPPIPSPPIIIHMPELGEVRVNATLEFPISGDLTLALIEFHVLATGESVLDLHGVTLVNDMGESIPYNEPGDGYFNNMLITRIFVDPPELVDPTMKPGDIFTIDIAIENAVGMSGYEFKLGYDTNVLTCLGAVVIPPTNDTNFTVEQAINDTVGVIWVKVQYYPLPLAAPISIYSAKAVTKISFQIQDYGQTVLDLYDADIFDQNGNSMNPVVEDGFFATLLRDVAIIYVNVTSSNIVYPGRIVTIDVTAMNRGNMTTETFDVTLYYDSNAIETETVTLDPWSNITLTFYWNTSGLTPCNNFTIWAEASEVPYEINLENNIFYDGWVKIKMLGDINGDGIIDILDIVAMSAIYGCREGDPNWNPDADLAAPWGVIDILDLVTVSSKYGATC